MSRIPSEPRPIPFDRFTADLLSLYPEPRMKYVLELVASLGVQSTAELTCELVARFLAALPADQSDWTTSRQYSDLQVACNYAVSMEYLGTSPFWRERRLEAAIRESPDRERCWARLAQVARAWRELYAKARRRQ